MAKTPLGKSQTLTSGEEHQEPIACRRIHENPYIGMIEMRQGIFKTGVSASSRPKEVQT
jgi:hypothetical protein